MRDELSAAPGELADPVLLDLALRVQPQALLHLNLDVESLRVEAVLIAEVVAPERLVALEDVLQRPAEAVVHAGGRVRGDRPVHEPELRPAAVLLSQLLEDLFVLPPLQNLFLEPRMVGNRRQRREDLLHPFQSRHGEQ